MNFSSFLFGGALLLVHHLLGGPSNVTLLFADTNEVGPKKFTGTGWPLVAEGMAVSGRFRSFDRDCIQRQ